ncbi:uncharacterized protein BJ171DRAFT_497178 [Polychytrium aggregatum]|uniref:uncharacterized protein n=1 Tax=Polychytrium aggregatum TaxID=110093 RepID=UPI0022FDCD72|nr:uncharacterized protein BJ171DRAFT_497178 [Polychytrium aggregatum]KAI9206286.1 hypothetical protein BJ171DRAFT_497178 [Polychytrium aggregatum]
MRLAVVCGCLLLASGGLAMKRGPWNGAEGTADHLEAHRLAMMNQFSEQSKTHADFLAAQKTGSYAKFDAKDDIYYYFALHDQNHDGHLDGHEIRNALTTFREVAEGDKRSLNQIERDVDELLSKTDLNNDGLVSWEEYLASEDLK